jgi:LEA14-like dessication related protein
MKNSFLPFLLCLAAVAFLPSCKSAKDPELKGIENVRIGRVGLSRSNLTFDMVFFNPNNYRMKLKEASGDAWLDGNPLGHFTVDSLVHIPALGDFRLPVRMEMDMKYLVENISAAFTDKIVTLKLDGKARAGKGLIFINYPLRFEAKQKFSELMK